MKRRSALILAACCAGPFLVSLDGTIVNVALPSIARELSAPIAALQWTVDAYLLVLAVLLLVSGTLADRVGRRNVFIGGVALFTLGSLLCGFASDVETLILFRMLQAVGGSAMAPVALAMLTNEFHQARQRANAIALWATLGAFGLAVGPLLGGFLVAGFDWRAIFWVNVPLGAATIVLTGATVENSRARVPRRFDIPGQLLVALFLVSLIAAIIELPGHGDPWLVVSLSGVAIVAGLCLVIVERGRASPVIPIALFRTRSFSGAIAAALLGFAAFSGLLFSNALWLQDARGLTAAEAGLLTLPLAAATMAAAPVSARLLERCGPRLPVVLAGGAMTVGVGLIAALPANVSELWLIIPYVVIGVGYGLLNTPVNDVAVSDLPDDQAGAAAGIVSTGKQIGSALGVAVVGTVLAATPSDPVAQAFEHRAPYVWSVVAAFALAIFVVGAAAFPRRPEAESSVNENDLARANAKPAGQERRG